MDENTGHGGRPLLAREIIVLVVADAARGQSGGTIGAWQPMGLAVAASTRRLASHCQLSQIVALPDG
jgi:hypothetical protein